jgi:hypothetical protein
MVNKNFEDMCLTVFLFAIITDRQIHNDDSMAGCAVFVSAVVCSIFFYSYDCFLS